MGDDIVSEDYSWREGMGEVSGMGGSYEDAAHERTGGKQ